MKKKIIIINPAGEQNPEDGERRETEMDGCWEGEVNKEREQKVSVSLQDQPDCRWSPLH